MEKESVFGYIMIIFILGIAYKMYRDSDMFQLKCVVSTLDGDKYCVRERKNLQAAADLLAKTTDKMKSLVAYAKQNDGDDPRVQRLASKFNPSKIVETLPTSEYTAYSENKGQKIAFCLNKVKEDDTKLIDENTLMFVAVHEMSHVASETVGHNDEFWSNFKYLLHVAEKAGVYTPINYKKKNQDYCGMKITDNPYYNK